MQWIMRTELMSCLRANKQDGDTDKSSIHWSVDNMELSENYIPSHDRKSLIVFN